MSIALFTLLAVAAFPPAPTHVDIALPTGDHHGIYLTEAEHQAAKKRYGDSPWATTIGDSLKKTADQYVRAELDIPRAGGQWSHWYTCKKEGGRLNAETPTRHVCQSCGEVYSGFPYDEVYVTFRHSYWLRGIESLGMAYAVEPKPEYAAKVREILLDYASFYETLPLHDYKGKESAKGARLYAQTLDESVSLCSLIFGYDLVYDAACFSPDDHATIADKLLRPMVATILRYKAGKSNWQSWHNGAIAATGFLLRDPAMVDFAINDPKHGFLYQMNASVLPSGMWYEGAPSYHWYALKAHVYLLEAAERSGVDLYALPVVHALFDGPTQPLFPDMTYPAINDSSRSSIRGASLYYEIAYRRYADPNYLALREPRTSPYALLWGKDAPEGSDAPKLELTTSNDKEGGLAILRDTARDAALFFNYNPEKGGHTHAAKLDLILYANGDERIVDPGRLSYGNPLHGGWYTQTLAHNTVVVDQKTQARASGVYNTFAVGENASLVRASLDSAYESVSMTRSIVFHDGVIVDQFQCRSEGEHSYDLPLHVNGTVGDLGTGTPVSLGEDNGYQHLKDLLRLDVAPSEFPIDTGKGTSLHVTFLETSEVFFGEGRAQPATHYIPMVLRRQQGKDATFTTVIQLLNDGDVPQKITAPTESNPGVSIGDRVVSFEADRIVLQVGDTPLLEG